MVSAEPDDSACSRSGSPSFHESSDITSSSVTGSGTDDFGYESEVFNREGDFGANFRKSLLHVDRCPSLSGSIGSEDTCSSRDDETSLQSADGVTIMPLSEDTNEDSDNGPSVNHRCCTSGGEPDLADQNNDKVCMRTVSLRVLVFVAAVVSTLAYVDSSRRASNIESIVSSAAGSRHTAGARIRSLETAIRQMGRDASRLRNVNRHLQENVETIISDRKEKSSDGSDDVTATKEIFMQASETTDRRRDRVTGLWKDIQIAAWRAIQDK